MVDNDNRHPNVFMISAPKTGTTSLHELLMNHSLCRNKSKNYINKEPNFYVNIDNNIVSRGNILTLENYLNLYNPRSGNEFSIDSSTNYMVAHSMYNTILESTSNVKVITVLRNPVDRLISGYIHFRAIYKAISNETIFNNLSSNEHFLGLQDHVRVLQSPYKVYKGHNINMSGLLQLKNRDFKSNSVVHLNEFYNGEYYSHIRALQDVFGLDNVHIISFDDLVGHKVNTVLSNLFEFLNIEYEDITLPFINTKRTWLSVYDSMDEINYKHIMALRDYYMPYNKMLYSHLGVEYDWDYNSNWYDHFGLKYSK